MKKMVMVLGLLIGGNLMAEPTVTSVDAQQRYPWNGLVDVIVTFAGSSAEVSQTECSFVATNRATQAALSVVHIIRQGSDLGNGIKWTRRFIWDAAADVGNVKVDNISLTVKASRGVQLWENGPYWAECNVGATKPEEYGHYFWWGDVVGYARGGGTWSGVNHYYSGVTWVSSKGVRMSNSPFTEVECPTYGKDETELQAAGYTDLAGNLVSAHDAAADHLGSPWRMPTSKEWSELRANCALTLVTSNGVHGLLVRGMGSYASNSIFLPSAGYGSNSGLLNPGLWGCYWSSTSNWNDGLASSFHFYEGNLGQEASHLVRYLGKSVRPLRGVSTISMATTHLSFDCLTGSRVASTTEWICFSPEWETSTPGASAKVMLDGAVVTNGTAAGVFKWTPVQDGIYTFKHIVCANDMPIGEALSATFVVEGLNPETPVITPSGETVLTDSQSVMITCVSEGAVVHYTTNGDEPTVDSPIYQRRFRVDGKTTVKAVAIYENGTMSGMAEASFALGRCSDPVIVSAGGETFSHGNVQVSIDWECADGVLRYTTDGSDVTETSPEYAGAFAIDDTTTIKAKAFGETYFDSKQVELTVTREWEPVATPLIAAAGSFIGRKTMVSILCATEGATIRYTVDGSEPNLHSMRYSGAFEVRESTVVKAFAMLPDYANSEVATKTITKVWGIGDSVGLPDHAFTTDGDAEWVDDEGAAMRSGKITHKQTSVLRSTFVGKGRLTFELKTSCEEDLPQYMEYDRAEVWMNGALKMKQDGVHDWMLFEFDLDGVSTTVEWRYVKDEMDDAKYPGEDCIWVRNIVWLPELTCTTEAPVELSWIREKFGDLGNYYYDYEEKAKESAANGHKVWECYVAGEDPTDKDSRFTATIKMGADGKPIVSWKPPLNGEDAYGAGIREGVRLYSVYGKQVLDDAAEEWTPVAEGNEGNYRFFKVGVGMPGKE